MLPVLVERLRADALLPERGSALSAGYDVFAYLKGQEIELYRRGEDVDGDPTETREDVYCWETDCEPLVLMPGDRAVIPLGIKVQVPPDYCIDLLPKSGLARYRAITLANAPGLGDADFADEYKVVVINHGGAPFPIAHGDKVAQFRFARYETARFEEGRVLPLADRTGGWGSTGRRARTQSGSSKSKQATAGAKKAAGAGGRSPKRSATKKSPATGRTRTASAAARSTLAGKATSGKATRQPAKARKRR